MKMIGNVSDWLSYTGGALIKVADSAGSTVHCYSLCIKCENLLRILTFYQQKIISVFRVTPN